MQDRSDKTSEFKVFLNNIQDIFIKDIFPELVQKALLLTGLDRLSKKEEQEARRIFVIEALKPINELIDNSFNEIELPAGLDKDEILKELKAVAKRYLSNICDKHILEFLTLAERKTYKQKRPVLIKGYGLYQREAYTFFTNDSLRTKSNKKWQEHITETMGRVELRENIGHLVLLSLVALGLAAGLIIFLGKMVETIIADSNTENGVCVEITPPFATTSFFLFLLAFPFAKALHSGFPLTVAPAKPINFTVYPPSQINAIREEIERKIKKMFSAANQKASQKEAVQFSLNTSQTIELQAIQPYKLNEPSIQVSEKEDSSAQSKVKVSKTTASVRLNASAIRSDSSKESCSTSQPISFIRCEGGLSLYKTLMHDDKFDKIMTTHKELKEPVKHALKKTEDRGRMLPSNSQRKSGLKRLTADECELKLKGLDARLFFRYAFKETQIVLSNPRLGKHK